MREEVHDYLGGTIRSLDSYPVIINGISDHVHILFVKSKNLSVSKIVAEVKRVSSIWVKNKFKELKKFYWQDGYGAFSVGRSEVNRICKYIENQEKHHLVRTFQDEYRKYLKEYEIEYDEKYVWD